ncbi:hypothetical protein ACYF6T_01615 [Streptomyces sp. 7R007]
MTAETLPVPTLPGPAWLPGPGTYTTAPDRCITELTARLGPLTTLRRRLTPVDASLTVAPAPEDCVLSLELGGRVLGGRSLTFVSTALKPAADGTRIHASGELALGDASVPAPLVLRVVERAEALLLVLGTIRLPYRPVRRTLGLALPRTRPADRIRLLVAAEFACPA